MTREQIKQMADEFYITLDSDLSIEQFMKLVKFATRIHDHALNDAIQVGGSLFVSINAIHKLKIDAE